MHPIEDIIENKNTVAVDLMCDTDNPRKICFEDVLAAQDRISDGVIKTPCMRSHLSKRFGMNLYLKNEIFQHTGSFKERGGRNALLKLSPAQRRRGAVAASSGNHAIGLSYHGFILSVPVVVVMPTIAPQAKIQKCKEFGAKVMVEGANIEESKNFAVRFAAENGMTYVNGYDHPDILAGQGTMGLEILEQVPDVECIIIPVGGGGALAGVSVAVKHLKPDVKIYAVETENCPSLAEALRTGRPTRAALRPTLADGLCVPTIGCNSFHTARNLIDKAVVVKDDWIAQAVLRLLEMDKIVVEGGGASGIAALFGGLFPELQAKTVVSLITGGNIDTSVLYKCMERGLALEQRLLEISVTVADKPGSVADLCRQIGSLGVAVRDIHQRRAWVQSGIFNVQVNAVCETSNYEQTMELEKLIKENYSTICQQRAMACCKNQVFDLNQ